jgi:FtsP/CotA-like multicopper oxidase with cupredoxin domain
MRFRVVPGPSMRRPVTQQLATDSAPPTDRDLAGAVRVNPNEIVELAVRFEGFSGRYMYHCHILEHEDRDMMRPIVVMPEQLGPFMS